ncbi:phosphatidylglycerophosphate synthase [Pacificimonas flava]|uniref:Phosphatidylglycerophosphate synthase n=2 Tax=Pacificimonas TaxID=1960290 RepID=A0A219B7R0_9SPHN|nr:MULTISPECIES: CDP-alcohol phosphatidyltransferase family protein [Pacificimonas]MBZ6378516.1 CDP-alcohol phosphatidyltransferase family protein [Pacificimonas aurantium]OWV34193.1 phosphatidylglycerophosphate synthase [Pacificimonas flava]
MTEPSPSLHIETVGENPTRLWGLGIEERTRRIGVSAGLEPGAEPPVLLANADFAADPSWLRHIAEHPGLVLTASGVPALANARSQDEADRLRAAMSEARPLAESERAGFQIIEYDERPTIEDKRLRKRETPFLLPLTPETRAKAERASYFGAYKGVTDLLTKYLWPEWALWLTRIAARIGMTPNMVTAIGAAFCIAATFAFAEGAYWLGMALGLVFMVLDTVDGKLARCTITSSWWGNIFDHGIDLVHPPFWYWFWGTGLVHWGLGLDGERFAAVMAAIIGGYVVQRVIEGVFMRRNGGMHIHVWRRFDSQFRLITARRNPNMVILFVSMLFSRPDLGLIAVAWWTVISCLVHAVRLAQAMAAARKAGPLTSWLAEA